MDCIKHYDFNKIDWSLDEIEKLDFKFVPTYKINPSFDSYHHSRYEGVLGNDVYFLPNSMPSFVDEILSLSIFDKYEIKPLMGVIPVNQDPDLLKHSRNNEFWERVNSWKNKGWEIAMHGCHHLYTQKSEKKKRYL